MRGVTSVCLLLLACGATPDRLHIVSQAVVLRPGEAEQLSFVLLDEGGSVVRRAPRGDDSPGAITPAWSTRPSTYATIAGDGWLTASSAGTARVSLELSDDAATAYVEIRDDPYLGAGFSSVDVRSDGCAVTTGGEAACWGSNWLGQLGIGFSEPHFVAYAPVRVHSAETFTAVAVGMDHACALTRAGAAFCWGDNRFLQLGRSDLPTSAPGGKPRLVGIQTPIVAISAYLDCTGGLTEDGRVVLWGRCAGAAASAPSFVETARRFRTLTIGGSHVCAVDSEGMGDCWGSNALGQLGTGGAPSGERAPRTIAGALRWKSLSAGGVHTCGVSTDGVAYCWGEGTSGALGGGDERGSFLPVAVASDERFAEISAGTVMTCARTEDGRAYCWGSDFRGQLGLGHAFAAGWALNVTAPRAVATELRFTRLVAGVDRACGITPGGGLYCWGAGPVGDGRAHFFGSGHVDATSVPLRLVAPVTAY